MELCSTTIFNHWHRPCPFWHMNSFPIPPAINGVLKLQRYIESVYNVHITAMSWAIWFQTVARSPPRRITTHSHDDMEVAWQQHLDMLLWDRMLFHPQPTLYTNSLLLLSLSIFVKCHEHMKIGFASTGTQMCQLRLFEHLNWKERVWSIFDVRWAKYQANDGTVIAGLPWVPCRAAICKRHSDTSKVHVIIKIHQKKQKCSLQSLYSSCAKQYWKMPKSLNWRSFWGYWLARCKALHRSAPKRIEHDPGTMRQRSSTASDRLCAEEGSLRNCKNCHGSALVAPQANWKSHEHMMHPFWLRHIGVRARRKTLLVRQTIESTNILALTRTCPLQDLSTVQDLLALGIVLCRKLQNTVDLTKHACHVEMSLGWSTKPCPVRTA